MLYVCGLDVREFFCAELKDNDATWWKSFLSYVRLEQMQRLKQIADWKRCVAAGFLEWYGLQCLYGEQMPPKTAIADNGKPYFSEFPGLHYNLSHAGDFVVAAFSDEPVGIDIAERRECKDSLIRRCLTETEMGWLKEQVDRNEAFCRLWAGKESFVKWTGDGLRKDLQQVEVTLDGAFFVRDLNPGETGGGGGEILERAYLKEWREPQGYSVCVCCGDENHLKNIRGIHWVTARELEELVK